MKKASVFKKIPLIFALIILGLSTSINAFAGKKVRDNWVEFHKADGISGIEFVLAESKHSSGQPTGKPFFSQQLSYTAADKMLIKVGRHKTKDVANWFKGKSTGGMFGLKSGSDQPKELNFAVYGTLNILYENGNFDAVQLAIAQGSHDEGTWPSRSTNHNWWVGGNQFSKVKVDGKTTIKHSSPFGNICILSEGGENKFKIKTC